MKKALLRILSVLAFVVMLAPNVSVSAQEKQTIPEAETTIQSNAPLITIERATGEIETFGYNDLFGEDSMSINARAWNYFTWRIPSKSITYANMSFNLTPNDMVAYAVTTELRTGNFQVGLRNNSTGQFIFNNSHVTAPGQYGQGVFTMFNGNFSFAIYNNSLYEDVFSGQFAKAE